VPAPIALIAYRRPDHLARVLSALRSNPECGDTVLYVFSDGPKTESDEAAVERLREIISRIEGFARVHATYRPENWGLSRNIIDSVSHVLDRHSEVILLEDDIFVAPHFLRFMNDGLAQYHDEHRVACISGYSYPIEYRESQTFFLRGADCWGWGTWRDRWAYFNSNSSELLSELKLRGLQTTFDFDGAWRISQELENHIAGRNDSWDICWGVSCFLKDMLTLYPARSLAQNIGFDGVASTHSGKSTLFDVDLASDPVPVEAIEIKESVAAREALKALFRRAANQSNRPAKSRILRRIAYTLSPTILKMMAEMRRRVSG